MQGIKKEDSERKARELQLDRVPAGGFITHVEPEQIVEEVYSPKPCDDTELPSSDNR